MKESEYTMEEHIHRYSCWTAARAASVGRFSNDEMIQFITESDLKNELDKIRGKEISSAEYMEWFIIQADRILTNMEKYKSSKDKIFRHISFGIAAKVVSIYVKTAEIIKSGGLSPISQVAFPPVDSYLLKGLNIKNVVWSNLEKDPFIELIKDLEKRNNGKPFWRLEYYWNLNSSDESATLPAII